MRPQVPIAGGITLIVVGAIFTFAITTRHLAGNPEQQAAQR
jgi:hypothetical protein